VKIGKLDRQLRIEQRATTQDSDYGTRVDTWTEYVTLWAQVQEVLPSKGESQADGIRIAERPARVRCRYVPGITSDMRAVDLTRSSRVMKIVSPPVELGNQDGLEFMVADYSTSGAAA
jgi:head-tail adaptor